MNNKEKYLPIGTVVLLKEGKKRIMITGFCIKPEEDKDKMYDYGACLYPEGIERTNKTFVFNHDQIDRILFMGYTSPKYDVYNNALTEVSTFFDAQKEEALEAKEITKVHVDIPVLDI